MGFIPILTFLLLASGFSEFGAKVSLPLIKCFLLAAFSTESSAGGKRLQQPEQANPERADVWCPSGRGC